MAPLFQTSLIQANKKEISVKPHFHNITILAAWTTYTQVCDTVTLSHHVINYIFPSASISQLTEEEKIWKWLIFISLRFIFDYVSMCTCVNMTKGTYRGQKRAIRFLGAQVWAVMSHPTVDVRKQPLVLWRSSKHWAASPALVPRLENYFPQFIRTRIWLIYSSTTNIWMPARLNHYNFNNIWGLFAHWFYYIKSLDLSTWLLSLQS